jgi:deoxyribonuclease-2
MYNDESPDEHKYESRAHSKGVVGLDAASGFWLVHSSPRFPDFVRNGYQGFGEGPNPASTKYGQSFLCLSLAPGELDAVAANMQVNYPHVHDSWLPAALRARAPNVTEWLEGAHVTPATATSRPLTTLGGNAFVAFAKNKAWAKDLYEDLVAPSLKASLQTETWQNGRGNMASYCTPNYAYDVENIQNVAIGGAGGVAWKHTQDHSKWAIGVGDAQFACIGDINRQVSQEGRGGGTVCATHPGFVSSMKAVVTNVSLC